MNAPRLRIGVIACLLILLAAGSLTPRAVAQAEKPALLRIIGTDFPVQVPRSYSFSVKLRVEYAFREYHEVHAAIYEGAGGPLNQPLWESKPERLMEVGQRIYEAQLKSPPEDGKWLLTGYVLFRNASGSYYFADEEHGPGFVEMSIKVADNARLTLRAPYGSIPVTIDGASYSTDQKGMLTRELQVLTEHTIEVLENVYLGEGWRVIFLSWNASDTSNPKSLMITTDLLLTIEFRDEFYLDVISSVPGVSGAGWYRSGSIANFTATPVVPLQGLEGLLGVQWRFTSWSGDMDSTAFNESIVMDRPHRVIADWTLDYVGVFSLITLISAMIVGGMAILFTRRRLKRATAVPSARTFCMFCGSEIDPNANFCSKCGKSQLSSG